MGQPPYRNPFNQSSPDASFNTNTVAQQALLKKLNPNISDAHAVSSEYLTDVSSFLSFQQACGKSFKLPNGTVDNDSIRKVKNIPDAYLRKVKYFMNSFIRSYKENYFITDFKSTYIRSMNEIDIKDKDKLISAMDSNPENLENFIASLREKFPTPFDFHRFLISFLYKAALSNIRNPRKIVEYKKGISQFLQIVYGDRYEQYIQYLGLRYRKLINKTSDLIFDESAKADIEKSPFDIVDSRYQEILDIEKVQLDIHLNIGR